MDAILISQGSKMAKPQENWPISILKALNKVLPSTTPPPHLSPPTTLLLRAQSVHRIRGNPDDRGTFRAHQSNLILSCLSNANSVLIDTHTMGRRRQRSVASKEWLVTELPHFLIVDILSRLPVETLFNCRCVCKTWLNFISDPFFVKLQLSRSPTCLLIQTISGDAESRNLQLARVEDFPHKAFHVQETKLFPEINLPNTDFELVNSCNGLVCLADATEGMYHYCIYVCNPILREYITIRVPNDGIICRTTFGLGFDARSNQYKVLQIFYPNAKHAEAQIYTIGTRIWRCIGNALCGLRTLDFNMFLHGSIHWVNCNAREYEFIYAFDFETEQLRQLSFPSQCHVRRNGFKRLGVFKGCLSFSFSPQVDPPEFDIWVMKEYGVKESWTKQFIIRKYFHHGLHIYEPLIFLSGGYILMLHNYSCIVCYCTKRKRFCNAIPAQSGKGICTIAYSPCFVSLQEIAKEELLEVLRIS